MFDANDPKFSFKTTAEVEAFSSWYLGATSKKVRPEYENDEHGYLDFVARRERRLKVQLDDLRNLIFDSAIPCNIPSISYYRIDEDTRKNPLSSRGSDIKNSRFNYKHSDLLKN